MSEIDSISKRLGVTYGSIIIYIIIYITGQNCAQNRPNFPQITSCNKNTGYS